MLARALAASLILLCLELGIFLIIVPWTPIWNFNYFLFRWPQLIPVAGNHFLRGAISGLGFLDVGIAIGFLVGFRTLTERMEGAIGNLEGSVPASSSEKDLETE